jgi:hypothetical protein
MPVDRRHKMLWYLLFSLENAVFSNELAYLSERIVKTDLTCYLTAR